MDPVPHREPHAAMRPADDERRANAVEAPPQDGPAPPPTRNPVTEGLLELGRNWATATAIALAGLAAFRTEVVTGDDAWTQSVSLVAFMIAAAWIYLAVTRLMEVLPLRGASWRGKAVRAATFLFLCVVGLGLILSIGKIGDNNHIVSICEQVEGEADNPVRNADECRRLYESRRRYMAELEASVSRPAAAAERGR